MQKILNKFLKLYEILMGKFQRNLKSVAVKLLRISEITVKILLENYSSFFEDN